MRGLNLDDPRTDYQDLHPRMLSHCTSPLRQPVNETLLYILSLRRDTALNLAPTPAKTWAYKQGKDFTRPP